MLNNIGIVHFNNAEYEQAMQYYRRAMNINTELDNKPWLANNLSNIGIIYLKRNDFKNGEDYINRAIKLKEELGDGYGMAINLYQLGALYGHQSQYDKSFEALFSALSIYRSGNVTDLMGPSYQKLAESYFNMAKDTSREGTAQLSKLLSGDKRAALRKARLYADSCLMMSRQTGNLVNLEDGYMILSDVQSQQGDKDEALKNYKTYILYKDSVVNIEKDKKLTQKSTQYEFDKKEAAEKTEQEKKDIRQKNIRNSISAGFAGALIFLVVVFRQRNKIKAGKKRSDELLLNILPEEVAEELKAKGSAAAKQFDEVTVMFTDFKGFTQISEKLSPTELVNEIHTCFKAFDEIISKHNIEKIKTIGDSYMCAGGLPVANKTHAVDVVKTALEIQQFMQQHLQERKTAGKEIFEIRIGIHTGTVVAGIVGVKKFAYDIWGDTVNSASRMESSGEAGKVNISGATYELVKDKFNCIHRGKIQAKNKGEIDMYFVEKEMG